MSAMRGPGARGAALPLLPLPALLPLSLAGGAARSSAWHTRTELFRSSKYLRAGPGPGRRRYSACERSTRWAGQLRLAAPPPSCDHPRPLVPPPHLVWPSGPIIAGALSLWNAVCRGLGEVTWRSGALTTSILRAGDGAELPLGGTLLSLCQQCSLSLCRPAPRLPHVGNRVVGMRHHADWRWRNSRVARYPESCLPAVPCEEVLLATEGGDSHWCSACFTSAWLMSTGCQWRLQRPARPPVTVALPGRSAPQLQGGTNCGMPTIPGLQYTC